MNRNDGNIIFSSLEKAEEEIKQPLPEGYAEIRLSTKGKLGAPEVFHIRNFKVQDIVALSLTKEQLLPAKLINILQDMIFEETDVSQWHEKEVEELMVILYMTFFSNDLEIIYPLEDSDIEKMKETEIGKAILEDMQKGIKEATPRATIHLSEAVDTYDLPNDFNPRIKITNKKTGFYVVFDYVHYGDQLVIKKWIDNYFKDEEAKFASVAAKIERNNSLLFQLKENPEKIHDIVKIDPEEQEAYDEFLNKKIQLLSEVIRIASILNFNGEDVSSLSLSEKYEKFSSDARLDYGMISKLSQKQNNFTIGIKPEVTMINPITKEVVKRPFSFRIPLILQAIQLSGADEYDDSYDDEA